MGFEMKIVIAGELRIQRARLDTAKEALQAMQNATRAEPGCVSYYFSQDLEHADRFKIFEEWESEQALQAHMLTEHMGRLMQALPGLLAAPLLVTKYEVASGAPL